MKRLQTFWHLFAITLLGSPLVSPLMMWTAVPCTHDGHLHYHRVAAMRYAWENGLLFSRWLPDVAFGLGYPFFVYREPTPLFASLFPHLLGMPLPAAENLFYAVTILACGWFMYLWVRDIFGARASIVSAMAYMAAPYVLVDALIRGNSPESLALPLFPLLAWMGRRWVINGRLAPFLITTFSLAFFSLSHNISLLIFTPVLLVYLLAVGWVNRVTWQPLLLRIVLLFVLGLGMTSFYSGGALLELDSVTLEQSTVTRNNDFRFNFVSTGEVFGPVAPEDPNLLNPVLPFRLGWMPLGLAVVGVLYGLLEGINSQQKTDNRKQITDGDQSVHNSQFTIHNSQFSNSQQSTANSVDSQRFAQQSTKDSSLPTIHYPLSTSPQERTLHIWLMLTATAVFLFMAFPISRWLWEGLPLIDFVQFPWRFVGRAALPLAFLAGVPFARNGRFMPILMAVAILLLFVETAPNLYPNICPEEAYPTINTVHNYERVTGLVGVDPEGSYFPRTVKKRPSASPLEPSYQAGQFPQRFTLPDSVSMSDLVAEPLGGSVRVTANAAFTAVYQTFDFAGWAAYVDGERVPITPSDPGGLITFPVPAGEHLLEVRWQSTPLRSVLLGFSLLSLAGTAVVAVVVWGNGATHVKRSGIGDRGSEARDWGLGIGDWGLWVLLGLGVVMLGVKVGVLDRGDSFLRQVDALGVGNTAVYQGGELQLNDYTFSARAVPSDGILEVDMAWMATAPPSRNYQTNVWLEDEQGQLWSDKNTFRPRDYEDAPQTLAWQPQQWAWESWEVEPLSGTPPGNYNVVMTLFDLDTLQPVTLLDANGTPLGPEVVLGDLFVSEPEEQPTFEPQFVQETAVPQTGLQLLGYNQDRNEAQVGEAMLVTVFVERVAETAVSPLTLTLQDSAGNTQASWPLPILDDALWEVGTRLRGQKILQLPGSLEGGTYQFMLNETLPLGEIAINAPERIFEQPVVETAVNTTFSTPDNQPIATLTGYTIPNPQSPIPLDLLWQAETETSTSYRVFVHLIDQSGNIVAQSDGEPAQWSRPTTSWAAGEFIIDTHQLTLPENSTLDQFQIRVGLYDENGRLNTPTGDAILLNP